MDIGKHVLFGNAFRHESYHVVNTKTTHDVFMEIWGVLHREISFKIKQIKQWTLVEI
jgi:hypothetical protein